MDITLLLISVEIYSKNTNENNSYINIKMTFVLCFFIDHQW